MKKPDIDALIDGVRCGDGIATTIVRTVLEQYYVLQEHLEKERFTLEKQTKRIE